MIIFYLVAAFVAGYVSALLKIPDTIKYGYGVKGCFFKYLLGFCIYVVICYLAIMSLTIVVLFIKG
jgi:hypothetical protein